MMEQGPHQSRVPASGPTHGFDPFEVADDHPQEMTISDYTENEMTISDYTENEIRDGDLVDCPFAILKSHARRGCPRCNPAGWVGSQRDQTGDRTDG